MTNDFHKMKATDPMPWAFAIAGLVVGAVALVGCGNSDDPSGAGGHGGSGGGSSAEACASALEHARSCGVDNAKCHNTCEARCMSEASCPALNSEDSEAANAFANCSNACDGIGGSYPGVGVGATSGPSGSGASTSAGPSSSSAGGGSSTGSGNPTGTSSGGGGDLAGCIAYVDNMCAVCNSLCSGKPRRNAIDLCDSLYSVGCSKANFDCQAHARTCEAAGQCPDC